MNWSGYVLPARSRGISNAVLAEIGGRIIKGELPSGEAIGNGRPASAPGEHHEEQEAVRQGTGHVVSRRTSSTQAGTSADAGPTLLSSKSVRSPNRRLSCRVCAPTARAQWTNAAAG